MRGAELTPDRHSVPDGNEAALPCGHAVDLDEAFEADTHHAVGSPRHPTDDARAEILRSPGQKRTHALLERGLRLLRLALPLTRLPLLRKPLRELLDLVADVKA